MLALILQVSFSASKSGIRLGCRRGERCEKGGILDYRRYRFGWVELRFMGEEVIEYYDEDSNSRGGRVSDDNLAQCQQERRGSRW